MAGIEQLYQGKKVAVVGYGVEGRSAYTYYTKHGADVTIIDEATELDDVPEEARTILGGQALDHLQGFDIVSRTPPLRPERIHTDGVVSSVTVEFFERCPAPIIGVTGTKGKGTTATLCARILEESGKKVHLVGNIGLPGLDVVDEIEADDIVCFELSSFQLWDLKKSPHVAVVLMIDEDHQDIHSSMDEYIKAKANIARFQGPDDVIVVHPDNQLSQSIAVYSSAKKVEYMSETGAFIRGEDIIIDEHKICTRSDVGLLGAHNLENVTAAISAAWVFTQNVDAIAKSVKEFKGLPHHLELAGESNGVRYYDDSFSTQPAAAIAAILTFEEPKVIILGGSEKSANFSHVAEAVADNNVKGVVLIGDTAQRIQEELVTAGFTGKVATGATKMPEIVNQAREMTEAGDVVILSPACASFGLFDNYKQRGDLFKQAVSAFGD